MIGNRVQVVGLCYRPDSSSSPEGNDLICELVREACRRYKDVILCGDFNYRGIKWDLLQSDSEGQKFLDVTLDCFMEQHVRQPTRGRNTLDLVLSTEGTIIKNIVIGEPLGNSDHAIVEFEIELKTEEKTWKNMYYDYRNGNYEKIAEYLRSYDW